MLGVEDLCQLLLKGRGGSGEGKECIRVWPGKIWGSSKAFLVSFFLLHFYKRVNPTSLVNMKCNLILIFRTIMEDFG